MDNALEALCALCGGLVLVFLVSLCLSGEMIL